MTIRRGALTRRTLFASAAAGAFATAPVAKAVPLADERSRQAHKIRINAAMRELAAVHATHVTNGDEQQFPNAIGNFTKGLPHNALGEVDMNAYRLLTHALSDKGTQADFEKIPMGSPDPAQQRKFVNPCSGVSFDLMGADSHRLAIPPAPSIQSADGAGDIVELYWQALLRDVPFADYESNAMTKIAATELSRLSGFRGPKINGAVTTESLFRGFTAGDLAGPYVSQFLLKPIPFGAQYIDQRMRTLQPGMDFLTSFPDWLASQNGVATSIATPFDATRRYPRAGRDLAQWVHMDVLYQAYFNAMLMMATPPDRTDDMTGGGMGVPFNAGNPYRAAKTQEGFGTFGPPAFATAVTEVATRALKAVWYQKWYVHRRLRPEAFGGLIHNNLSSAKTTYPVHSDVLNSNALELVRQRTGTYLLPQAFPEGSPLHPSYGAGHATVAGACVTMLKALFDENWVIPNPVTASTDGLSLVAYTGADRDKLTVGGELNKLAANVAIGRNFAGIHYRSDYAESLRLGEAIAMSILDDQRAMYAEDFAGYTFTRFDGQKVTVG